MIKPNARFNKITDIDLEFFKKNNIKGVILDVDNTLIDKNKIMLDDVEKWLQKMKNENIKFCISSNSINKEKVTETAKKLDIPFVYFSTKPLKRGIKKAIKVLGIEPKNIAEIGDQVFTDVWVSNKMGLFSILTEPLSDDSFKIAIIKRKFEKWYLSKNK